MPARFSLYTSSILIKSVAYQWVVYSIDKCVYIAHTPLSRMYETLMLQFAFRGFIKPTYRRMDMLTSIIGRGLSLSIVCGMMVPHIFFRESVKNSMVDTVSVV